MSLLTQNALSNEVICYLDIYVTEHDIDEIMNPEDYGPSDIKDDEARVFHHHGQLLIRMN